MSEPLAKPEPAPLADWEAFYASYRKPGYVPGFEITSKLGGGMFGLVYKATRQSIGKDYAIKFLKVDDGEVRRAVLQELEQVKHFAQVDHPNLVSIEDKGEVDGIPFLVMAYAGHETLKNRLPGDASTRAETLRLFLQACRGVAALHEKSLVHFDLKPANVFLKSGVARVGDYGLSKLVTHSQRSLSMGRGTPYYMAPEILERRGDHRSDVYSLGVMLFEVLTGDVPFKGDSEWEVLKKHKHAELVFPDHVPARERAIVQRCMHKDPDQRWQNVSELLAAFGAPTGVGAAAWYDTQRGLGAAPPPAATAPKSPGEAAPKPDDPYVGLRKATKEAYTHASKIAREAMQNAGGVARKAAAEARSTMQEMMRKSRSQHVRRARAWVRWHRMERSRRQRERERIRAERRAARRGVWRGLTVFAGIALLVLAAVFLALEPVSVRPVATVAGPPSPRVPVLAAPPQFASALRTKEPQWVVTAQRDLTAAKEQLRRSVERFREIVPLAVAERSASLMLPRFAPPRVKSTDEHMRTMALLANLEQSPEWRPDVAQQLRAQGFDALCFAAESLRGKLGVEIESGARNVHRFLVESTGFDAIELAEDAAIPDAQRQRANERIADVWLWYLHEFGYTPATWSTYIQLRLR